MMRWQPAMHDNEPGHVFGLIMHGLRLGQAVRTIRRAPFQQCIDIQPVSEPRIFACACVAALALSRRIV